MIPISEQYLYVKIIKKIYAAHPSWTAEQIMDSAVSSLYTGFIPESDRRLMQLALRENINQQNLNEFLNQWDIESVGVNRAILLAYVMKMHPELKFDDYTGPRLKGVLNYLRFQNLELISHFSKIVRALNQKNIIPILIKGGAMRHLRPDLPRIMGDIDILIHSSAELNVAKKLVLDMGYIYEDSVNSIDVHPRDNPQKGILDIHRYFGFLPQCYDLFNKELFARTEKQRAFSVDVCLPAKEDLFFICLNNLAQNLRNDTSIGGIPYAVFDLLYLIDSQKDFNWDIVARDIFMTHTEALSYFAMRFVDQIIPDIFPKKILSDRRLKKEMENFINYDKFYSLYVHDVKRTCKKLKLIKAMHHWGTFKDYLRLEGQHFLTKRIIKYPLLIRLFFKFFHG